MFVTDTVYYRNTYPKCIIGPSGPTGKPQPTHVTHEKNFTTIVLMLKICLTLVPFKKPVISGIPDPPAHGRRY